MILATYTRFSSDMQRYESITAQLRAIEDWAVKNGHTIIHNYIDEAVSGRTDDRPQFQKMIADSKENTWEGIVVHKLDRFARNRYDSAMYKKILKENGKIIFSVTENLDNSPESIILESVIEGMSEYYSANLGRETKKGHRENAFDCKFNGGTPLLGYNIDENLHYIINEQEAIAVKLIFDLYSKGYSISKIVNKLNLEGHKTKRGNKFGKNSIYDVLHNEKYIGKYIFGYGGRQKNRNKPLDDVIIKENGIPAIIENEVWNMVQARKKMPTASNKAKRIYILTGILYCGECGASYIGNSNHNTGRYTCKNKTNKFDCKSQSIQKNAIEQYILHNLYEILSSNISDEFIDRINKLYLETKKDAVNELNITTNKLSGIDYKMTNIVKAISLGNSLEILVNELKKLQDEKNILLNKIELLKNIKTTNIIKKEYIVNVINNELRDLKFLPEEEQKTLLHKYINRITIYNDKIDIDFNLGKKNTLQKGGYDWWAGVEYSNILHFNISVPIEYVKK